MRIKTCKIISDFLLKTCRKSIDQSNFIRYVENINTFKSRHKRHFAKSKMRAIRILHCFGNMLTVIYV